MGVGNPSELKKKDGGRMNIRIRPYIQKDYRYLKEMIFALYKENPEGETINEDKIEDTVIELSSNPSKGRIIVFECDETIIGYAILIVNWSNKYGGNILVVDELYIKPEWRNKGIGTRILNTAHLNHENVVGLRIDIEPPNKKTAEHYIGLGLKETGNTSLIKTFTEELQR